VTKTLENSAGFTLIELLIAMAMSLALGIGGFAFYRSQAQSLTDQSAGLDAIEGARAALDFMSADIRMAGANPAGTWSQSGTCGAGLSEAGSTSLKVTWDGANGDATYGTINGGETTKYSYDSTSKSILRTVNGVDTTLIKNVPSGGLSFQYYTANGPVSLTGSPAQVPSSGTNNCNNVTYIKINVQVQTARGTTITTVPLSSYVALRNRQGVLNKL